MFLDGPNEDAGNPYTAHSPTLMRYTDGLRESSPVSAAAGRRGMSSQYQEPTDLRFRRLDPATPI
jgi:hypothetical protein